MTLARQNRSTLFCSLPCCCSDCPRNPLLFAITLLRSPIQFTITYIWNTLPNSRYSYLPLCPIDFTIGEENMSCEIFIKMLLSSPYIERINGFLRNKPKISLPLPERPGQYRSVRFELINLLVKYEKEINIAEVCYL